MEKSFEMLEQILNRELDIHVELLKNGYEFNSAIKNNDLGAMQQHTAIHDEMICQIEKLEEQRLDCSQILSILLGLETPAAKISNLLEQMPPVWQSRLSKVQKILKEKIFELSKINKSNQILLEEAILIINGTFALLQKPSVKYAQYGKKGAATNRTASLSLINRIA
jgi:flagellar biosynthesis/type III secretory pathway chaperone